MVGGVLKTRTTAWCSWGSSPGHHPRGLGPRPDVQLWIQNPERMSLFGDSFRRHRSPVTNPALYQRHKQPGDRPTGGENNKALVNKRIIRMI